MDLKSVKVDNEIHHKVKVIAAKEDRNIRDVIRDALRLYQEKKDNEKSENS